VSRELPAVLAALALAAAPLGAQQRDPHAVQPERPTVATHAYAVAPGWVELEIGAERDREAPGSYGMAFPATLKLGLAERVQLNVTEPVVHPIGVPTGLGDINVALKWRVLDGAPVLNDFAVMPGLKLPTAPTSNGRGTGTWDASLLLISSRRVGPVAVDLNAGYTRRSGDGTTVPRTASVWTASTGGPVAGAWGWVVECYGYPGTAGPAGQAPIVALLAGPTVLVREWLAIDAGFVAPLAGPQPQAVYLGSVINIGRAWGQVGRPER